MTTSTTPDLVPRRSTRYRAHGKAALRAYGDSSSTSHQNGSAQEDKIKDGQQQQKQQQSEATATGTPTWCTFTELSCTFPFKLMTPRVSGENAPARVRAWRRQQRQQRAALDAASVAAAAAAAAGAGAGEEAPRDSWEDRHDEQYQRARALEARTRPSRCRAEAAHVKPVGVLYVVGYGGGLVGGDAVSIDFDAGAGATLLLLTQGSTKVFKVRAASKLAQKLEAAPAPTAASADSAGIPAQGPGDPLPPNTAEASREEEPECHQYFRMLVRPGATLVLLPDAVTCFERSRYSQVQRIDMQCKHTSSLLLLDWYTPGRTLYADDAGGASSSSSPGGTASSPTLNVGEMWGFDRYRSRNEIRAGGEVIVRDSLLLEQDPRSASASNGAAAPGAGGGAGGLSLLAQRMRPYGCYATVYLVGPDFQLLIDQLAADFHQVQQRMLRRALPLLWSFSIIEEWPASPAAERAYEQTHGTRCGREAQPSQSPARERLREHARGGPGAPAPEEEEESALLRSAVLRVAGKDADAVRAWLHGHLLELQDVIGDDLYVSALGTESDRSS